MESVEALEIVRPDRSFEDSARAVRSRARNSPHLVRRCGVLKQRLAGGVYDPLDGIRIDALTVVCKSRVCTSYLNRGDFHALPDGYSRPL